MSGSPLASVAVKLLTITPAPSTLPMANAVAMGAVLATTVGTGSTVASGALAAATTTSEVVSVSLSSAVVPNVKLRSFRTSLTLDKSTKLEPLLISCRICPAAVASSTSLMSLPLSSALITVSIVA